MWVLIISLIVFLLAGIPIGYAIGISSLVYVLVATDMSLMVIPQQISNGSDSFVLLALPFFLLAGEIMNAAGITQRLIRFLLSIIGPARGGLSYVVIVVNALVAMVSGAAIASAAAVGSTLVPIMSKEGYPRGYAAALNASAATIGPVIPPSIGFVIYASVSGGEVSVGKLFLAGTVPGVLIALLLLILCVFISYRKKLPKGEAHSKREVKESFVGAIWGLVMPVIILGGIFGGMVTPTEAGVVAVFYGLLVGFFIYRTLTIRKLLDVLLITAKRTATIMLIVSCASAFGFLIAREVEASVFVEFFQSVTSNPQLFLLLIIGLILILGTVMEGSSVMIIFTPLLLPVLKAYGVDPVHFGVVFQLGIMIGLLTPPVGILLFVVSGVSRVSVNEILKNIWPFYGVLVVATVVIALNPGLTLFLVNLFGGQLK